MRKQARTYNLNNPVMYDAKLQLLADYRIPWMPRNGVCVVIMPIFPADRNCSHYAATIHYAWKHGETKMGDGNEIADWLNSQNW